MDKTARSLEYFRNKFNCSQSVFTVFGASQGLDENTCLKLSCAFGGGMGRCQHTCGAVTGALMVIGLKYGRAMGDPEVKKDETYAKTREFFDEFKKMNGSIVCRDLLKGLDMNDPEDHKKIKELGLFDTLCEKYIADSIRIVEKMV